MPKQYQPPVAERIGAEIVRRITSGKLKPGDRIVEQSLADEFDTSRGPVRDALKILAARNWIELLPRQGARVSYHEETPQLETILISAAMLGLAYRFAVMKADDRQIETFYQKVRHVIELGQAGPSGAEAFSAAILDTGNFAISLADNRKLDDVIGPVPQGALSSYIPLGVHSEEAMQEAVALWVELGTAFKLRDHVSAERIGRAMVESSFRRILELQLTDAPRPRK